MGQRKSTTVGYATVISHLATMIRRGETYVAGSCSITPFMDGANCYFEFRTELGQQIILTKSEFECLMSGLNKVESQFRTLDLAGCKPGDEVDSPYPSHMYAEHVLELGEGCCIFTAFHNNSKSPYICLRKDGHTLCLDEYIFGVHFYKVYNMMDVLARSFAQNWCWYCNKHTSHRNNSCVVCLERDQSRWIEEL